MEKFILKEDIPVFYVKAETFPAGIKAAHEKLHAMLGSVKDRRFFGISNPDGAKGIVYRAAVEEAFPGEAEKYGCEKFTIRKGTYISEQLKDWQRDESIVARTFQQLLEHPDLDHNGYCLEMYLNEKDMRCMVTLKQYETTK